jgi:hypothetical protein
MGLTRAEQETVIRWDEAEQEVRIWSASPKTWRRIARLGVAPYRETTTGGEPSGEEATYAPGEYEKIARSAAHAMKSADGLVRLMEFASGRPDSRADVGTDWLRALTNEQLAIVSGWIEAAGAAGDRQGRASHEAGG